MNTRLRPAPQSAGTVITTMTGQLAASPTDSFTLQKQVFAGSTDCSTGGGPITYVSNVSAGATDSTSLTSADSLRLQPSPSSNRNGQFVSFQNTDMATFTYLPGNAVCVAGFGAGTHVFQAQFSPGVQLLNATCSSPKYYFQPGETVCVRASGTNATGGSPWHAQIFGGSPNSCNSYPGFPAYPGAAITAETQAVTFTVPASNASIPAGCAAGNTTDIRGYWQAYLLDSSNNARGSDTFRVHSANGFYDLSVYVNPTDYANQSPGWPPVGYIRYQISVSNSGPDAAVGVSLVQSIAASTNFVSMTQTGGPAFVCTGPSGGNETCTIGVLPPDSWASFDMLVHYPGPLAAGTNLTSNSTLSATSGADSSILNNTAATTVTIQNPPNTQVGQLICPADILQTSASAAGKNVTYPMFTTTYTWTSSYTASTPASGALFPIGTTLVGWQALSGSGACFFKVTVTDGQRPDLSIVKSHVGNFPRGLNGQKYTIVVTNTGGVATLGLVTVTDTLPSGAIPTSISGTGWTCSLGTLSCARADALASHGSYPPITIIFDLPYYLAVGGPFTNKAFVFGGGDAITSNNESDDLASVVPPLATPTAGDFNLDARSDLVWRNETTQQSAVWNMNSATPISSAYFNSVPLPWMIQAMGDFDGDGRRDVVLRNTSSGQNAVWFMNGSTVFASAYILSADPAWTLSGAADFNGDAKPDLLWRNYSTGQNGVWFLDGTTVIGTSFLSAADPAWTLVGTGDFNDDGKPDLVWRNYATGDNGIWYMNDVTVTGSQFINSVSTVWQLEAIGDFNGDSKPDFAWRNYANGQSAMWFMSGPTLSSTAYFPYVSASWHIVGPR